VQISLSQSMILQVPWVFGSFGLKFQDNLVKIVREIIFILGTHKTINFETNTEVLQPRTKKLHFWNNSSDKTTAPYTLTLYNTLTKEDKFKNAFGHY